MKKKLLDLSPGLSSKILEQLEALPCFSGVTTPRLSSIAEGKLRGKYEITSRVTAMLVIVGNTPLTDEVFQLPPTISERNIGG